MADKVRVAHVRDVFHCEAKVENDRISEITLTVWHDGQKRTALHIETWMVPYVVGALSKGLRKYAEAANALVAELERNANEGTQR